MQNRSGQSDEEEDANGLMFFGGTSGGFGGGEEDKTMNVYDEKYDQYIEMGIEDLGLTSEVEGNLGFHPLSTNYISATVMNVNYVKKNLKEAQKFLRDEESYAFRNIFDRCFFLLTESNDASVHSKAYNLAKNDANLKMARLIFRYRNNLDDLFELKQEPSIPPQPLTALALSNIGGHSTNTGGAFGRKKSVVSTSSNAAKGHQSMSEDMPIYQYKHLQGKDQIEFNGTKLSRPVTTKVDKTKTNMAVLFNKSLFNLCEQEYQMTEQSSRATYAVSLNLSKQCLFRCECKR
jgi:hypothetical protein